MEDILTTLVRHRNDSYLQNNNIKNTIYNKEQLNSVKGINFIY